jgi:ATP-dependent Clp protease ATP-binding subunit ClpX
MAEKCCTFCKKPSNEVKTLIGSEGGPYICNKCVGACVTALSQGEQTEKAKKKGMTLGKPKEIKAKLDEYVISQERAKVDVAVAVYNHYKRRVRTAASGFEGVEIQKSNILMAGPSGTGKTEIARTIARLLDVPFYVADATKMTQAGYVGEDVESMLQGLISDAGGDIERAQWGMIVIDEIDKLARKSGRSASGHRDVTGEGVQQALLKIIEGSTIAVPRGMAKIISTSSGQDHDMIDTSNILFLCFGSFAGIEEVVSKRINKNASVGFAMGANRTRRKELTEHEVYESLTEEDILEFGVIPELVGRLPILTTTYPLTEDELVRILTEPKSAIVKQFQALFALDLIDLQFDDEALKAIGRGAKKRPTGARALRSIMEAALKQYAFDCPSDPTIKAVRITQGVIEEAAEALLVREEKAKSAKKPAVAVEA